VRFAVKIHLLASENASPGETRRRAQGLLNLATVEGRAHEAWIEFFAKLLKVLRCSVTIASGQTRRGKVIRVQGLSAVEVRQHTEM
jgi:uncharacterized protein YggU (UPF0235/DUF167 family)